MMLKPTNQTTKKPRLVPGFGVQPRKENLLALLLRQPDRHPGPSLILHLELVKENRAVSACARLGPPTLSSLRRTQSGID